MALLTFRENVLKAASDSVEPETDLKTSVMILYVIFVVLNTLSLSRSRTFGVS